MGNPKRQRVREADGSYSRVYHWEDWFAKGSFRLPARPSSLAIQIRNAASRLGYSVNIRELKERGKAWLVVTALKRSKTRLGSKRRSSASA